MFSPKSPKLKKGLRSPVLLVDNIAGIVNTPVLSPDEICQASQTEYVEEVAEVIKGKERKRWLKGLFALFILVSTWILSTQLTNSIVKNGDYNHPLFVSYVNGSFFILYGIPTVISRTKNYILKKWSKFSQSKTSSNHQHSNNQQLLSAYHSADNYGSIDQNINNINNSSSKNVFTSTTSPITDPNSCTSSESDMIGLAPNSPRDADIISVTVTGNEEVKTLYTPRIKLTHYQMMKLGLQSCFIYFTNCACGNAALRYTSATNQTILVTTTSLFILILGSIFKVEKFTYHKLLAIIVSIIGISCIAISDTAEENSSYLFSFKLITIFDNEIKLQNPLLGDFLALCSAFFYGSFIIFMRLKMGEETDPEDDKLVFMYLGIFTLILVWPVLVVFDYIGFESFQLPQSKTILLIVLLAGLSNCISDYCSILASLLTTPLITALSMTTGIPISMICESLFYHQTNTSMAYYLGIILIFSSFIFTNLEGEKEVEKLAIEDAFEEAIDHNELLSPLLSPYLSGRNHISGDQLNDQMIPGFSIDDSIDQNPNLPQQIIVTGGTNHKYFIRDINQ
ncbi:hypothetical protein B5S32_g828 [[Candida] boidinii]|nr:hypothetical protein B5S32_g828 [[Candida] boidinii]